MIPQAARPVEAVEDDVLEQIVAQSKLLRLSQPITNFPLFPELPTELRLKIWRETFPGPRIVAARYEKGMACTSLTKIPLALQVNTESRQEAKRFYRLSFGGNEKLPGQEPKVWFDNSTDIFYIDGSLGGRAAQRVGYTASGFALISIFRNITGLHELSKVGVEVDFLRWFCNSLSPSSVRLRGFASLADASEAYIVQTINGVHVEQPGREEGLQVIPFSGDVVNERLDELAFFRDATGVHWIPVYLHKSGS